MSRATKSSAPADTCTVTPELDRMLRRAHGAGMGERFYGVSVTEGYQGRAVIVLSGPRGAEYRSICNVHDGLHRFIERPAQSYILGILAEGTVGLAREVLAERRAAA